MYGGRDDDPFGFGGGFGGFNHVHRQMRDMDRMMEHMMDPFDMLGMRRGPPPPRHMIEHGPPPPPPHPFGMMMHPMMMNPFGGFGMGGLFQTMNQLQHQAMNSPDSVVFSQSTMMTFDEDGNPRVVKKSLRKAGDAREERRELRERDREEMEIGHSLGDRTHVIMKKRDKDGLVREQQRFVNLDEAGAEDFDSEFQHRVRSNFFGDREYPGSRRAINGASGSRSRGDRADSTSRQYRESSSADAPIITLPEEERREEARDRPSNSRSSRHQGPVIREISDEEAESSITKKRRGPYGI